MDETTIKELRAAANRGIEAVAQGQADQASVHFNNALNLAEDLQDGRARREELSVLSTLFFECSFPDLALMAAEESVELDRSLGLNESLVGDIIALGNAHQALENTTKAEACFQEALAICLKGGDWADAASATTNIAALVANRGEMAKAIELLEQSLGYLAKEPFEHTEIQTRFALLQLLELDNREVDRAVENARQLCGRFWDKMPVAQRKVTQAFVDRVVKRYLAAHPRTRPNWRAKNFPLLYR